MFRPALVIMALSLPAFAPVSAVAAQARAPAPALEQRAPGIGAPVRGANGEVLGRIESVTRDSAGQPVQVVVRTRGLTGVRAQSRAVPITSLRPDGSGWVLPLRRAEFNLLPQVRP
ncbi:MAG: hypothetical protein KY446_04025 [Proteobacteria bacterium]|nr:hypothetical protein [Pseudomonadota bacterium]MBW3616910.1 hypothetical protein [Pseudomonadota bacterium]